MLARSRVVCRRSGTGNPASSELRRVPRLIVHAGELRPPPALQAVCCLCISIIRRLRCPNEGPQACCAGVPCLPPRRVPARAAVRTCGRLPKRLSSPALVCFEPLRPHAGMGRPQRKMTRKKFHDLVKVSESHDKPF